MKNPIKPKYLPWICLIAGILGFCLQVIFLAAGADERGLLASGHWADALSWILTALVMLCLGLGIRDLGGVPKFERLFPPSLPGALGCGAAAVGVAITSIRTLLADSALISTLAAALGFAGTLCLVALGYYRLKGRQPKTMLRVPVILFFMLFILCQYQQWSKATQLPEYAFPLFASVFVMLSAYQRAALEAKLAGRRMYIFFTLGGGFFCLLAVPGSGIYYLCLALWLLLDHCSLFLMQKKTDPDESEAEGA